MTTKKKNDDIDVHGLTFECERTKMGRSWIYFQMKCAEIKDNQCFKS